MQAKTKTRGEGDTETQKPKDAAIPRSIDAAVPRQEDLGTQGPKEAQTPRQESAKALREEDAKTPRREDVKMINHEDMKAQRPIDATAPRKAETETRERGGAVAQGPKDAAMLGQTDAVTLRREETGTTGPRDGTVPRQADLKTTGETDASHRIDRIANDEEIRHFFAHYIDRYARKVIDRFLSCFSSKAIQNRKEGLHGIRKIYAAFFKQSRDLRYELQDLRSDFYQNQMAVKARYQLDQVSKKGERRTWKGDIQWTLIKEEGALKILFLDYQQQK